MMMSPTARQNSLTIAQGTPFTDLTVQPPVGGYPVNRRLSPGSPQSPLELKRFRAALIASRIEQGRIRTVRARGGERRCGDGNLTRIHSHPTHLTVRRILRVRRNHAHAPLPMSFCQVWS